MANQRSPMRQDALPQPEAVWNPRNQARRDEVWRQADANNHKRNQDIEAGDGRVIIRSPNGNRWAIAIDNAGVVSATAVP